MYEATGNDKILPSCPEPCHEKKKKKIEKCPKDTDAPASEKC